MWSNNFIVILVDCCWGQILNYWKIGYAGHLFDPFDSIAENRCLSVCQLEAKIPENQTNQRKIRFLFSKKMALFSKEKLVVSTIDCHYHHSFFNLQVQEHKLNIVNCIDSTSVEIWVETIWVAMMNTWRYRQEA